VNRLDYLSHNWLALKINNDSFQSALAHIRGRVLDLGCGTSQYKKDILNVAAEYIGVDWKNSFHDQSNVDIFADLTKRLPFGDEHADTIISFQVLEHLQEPCHFMAECYRLLKPGGHLVITVPFMWHIHEAPFDFFRYTRHGLDYLLTQNGFAESKILECTGFWQMWVLKFNYHTVRYAKGLLKSFWIPLWWLGQKISPLLDRIDRHPQETAGYTVLARKPLCL
jgi:SAM-dependent methyltransferase